MGMMHPYLKLKLYEKTYNIVINVVILRCGINIESWNYWTIWLYKRRCLRMIPGISPAFPVSPYQVGSVSAPGSPRKRISAGWKIVWHRPCAGFWIPCMANLGLSYAPAS